MARTRLRPLLAAAALTAAALALPAALAAVLVAPHAVFMTHRVRTGQLQLHNTGTRPEEVTIELKYGYPAADSTGRVQVQLTDQPDSTEPSAAGWVRAFPRRLVLAPGERQVVRLLASPPDGLADGEYWSRIVVTSRGGQVRAQAADSGVTTGIDIELRTVLSLIYRKGTVTTAMALDSLAAVADGDSLVAVARLERGGNGAWIGNAVFSLVDSAGATVRSWTQAAAVYRSDTRRFVMPLDSLPAGAYRLRLELNTERNDVDRRHVLQSAPVADSLLVEIG
jgi:P pilus assembly chaperone PapD